MDSLTGIQTRIRPWLDEMNRIIRASLASSNELMDSVTAYYMESHGKQIRPIMVILSGAFFGKVNEEVLYAGAALEMLHNASLIHDDVVDETTLRRGKASVNSKWGNHIAVLVGDFFVSNALGAAIHTGNIRIISSLSELGKELSLGEIDQICNVRDHNFEEERYFEMIRKKTASLFRNCVKLGAEGIGVTAEEYKPLMQYAELLGLCFQIRDDIFDYTENPLIGKPTGNDLREGKVTLPLLYALRTADPKESALMKEILRNGDLNDTQIDLLIQFAINNGGIDYAYDRMRQMEQEADKLLENYPDSEWKQAFRELFDYVISRNR